MIKRANLRFSYPFVFGLLFGILSSYLYLKDKSVYAFLIFVIAMGIYISLFLSEKRKLYISLIIIFACFFIGFFYYKAIYDHYLSLNLPDGVYNVSGQVQSVYESDKYYVILKSATIEKGYKLSDVKVRVIITGGKVNVGDYISFKSEVTYLFSTKTDVSSLTNGITHSASVDFSDISTYTGSKTIFEKINLFIKNSVYRNNPKEIASVSYAMLTGNTAYMPQDKLQLFRFAGVAHIFAVSGLHIGFLAHFLNYTLIKCKVKSIIRTVVITLILIIYSGICNFTVSSVRAVIMCFLLMLCSSLGKKYDMINALCVSMFITLMINPFNLFEVGFQLSYSAVFGIGSLSVVIAKKLSFLPEKLASMLAVTLSATLMTLPVCINAFGYLSPLSIGYNLVIIPLIYPIFISLIVCVLFTVVFKKFIFFWVPRVAIKGIIGVLDFTKPDLTVLKNVGFTFGLPAYYFATVLMGDKINIRNKYLRLTLVLACYATAVTDLFII